MVVKAVDEVDLRGFLEAAGQSFADAQATLVGNALPVPSAIAISDAELEVKAAVTRGAGGTLSLQPLSAETIRAGGIDPGLVSSLRIRYVAVPGDARVSSVAQPPKRSPAEVIDEARKRQDLATLGKILGGLAFEPVYVPDRKRWLVSVLDPERRVVREIVVPDDVTEGDDG